MGIRSCAGYVLHHRATLREAHLKKLLSAHLLGHGRSKHPQPRHARSGSCRQTLAHGVPSPSTNSHQCHVLWCLGLRDRRGSCSVQIEMDSGHDTQLQLVQSDKTTEGSRGSFGQLPTHRIPRQLHLQPRRTRQRQDEHGFGAVAGQAERHSTSRGAIIWRGQKGI